MSKPKAPVLLTCELSRAPIDTACPFCEAVLCFACYENNDHVCFGVTERFMCEKILKLPSQVQSDGLAILEKFGMHFRQGKIVEHEQGDFSKLKVGDIIERSEFKFRVQKGPGLELQSIEDIISQQLPPLQINPSHAGKSSTKSLQRHYPKRLLPMKAFLHRGRFFYPRVKVETESGHVVNLATKVTDEPGVMEAFSVNVAAPLSACGKFGEVVRGVSGKRIQGLPDGASFVGGNAKAIVEGKTPWTLSHMPKDAKTIADRYNAMVEHVNARKAARAKGKAPPCKQTENLGYHSRRALAQEVGYMLDNQKRWGAITCYDYTWFIYADTPETFYISDALACTDPDALRIWAFFFYVASVAQDLVIEPKFLRARSDRVVEKDEKGDYTEAEEEAARQSEVAHDADETTESSAKKAKKAKKEGCVPAQKGKRKYSDDEEDDPSDPSTHPPVARSTAASFLSKATSSSAAKPTTPGQSPSGHLRQVLWGQLKFRRLIGAGRSGQVFETEFDGNLVAVKVFDLNFTAPETAFGLELRGYERLKIVQGEAVPKLLFITQSFSGALVGLGLDLGKPLPTSFELWNDSDLKKAYNSVEMIANSCKVAHLDLRPENFVVGDTGKIFLVDWEESEILQKADNYLDHARQLMR